ncbi:MAG: IS91 family transposase [bacterium]|nr:MAG: IS91 family transposase [bacterium]
MTELADIFREKGDAYLKKYGNRMPPSHKKVMRDVLQCRTADLGGHVFLCEECNELHYSYHSCKNRNCPKCQNESAEQWLQEQKDLLLPVTYFMVTFTLPDSLRPITRSHQNIIYNLLFRTSAEALRTLAQDPKYVGGMLGMMGVLQTWTRDLLFHPHVHYMIPGGGLSENKDKWLPARKDFLMPAQALSKIFKAKFQDALKKTNLYERVPSQTWKKKWVVHIEPVETGEHALKYLAPYIFRVAISNNNILRLSDGLVTFRYRDSDTDSFKTKTIPAEEFIRRFLQHVLPHRFMKLRYYGFLCSRKRKLLEKVKELLTSKPNATKQKSINQDKDKTKQLSCPKCGSVLIWLIELPKKRGPPLL